MKIAIVGRKKDTFRYEKYFSAIPAHTFTTLSLGELDGCDAVILPGGGDITPAFFGELNKGSNDIDTELDILQIQTVDFCIRYQLPLLGICKGMQVINVALGVPLFKTFQVPICTSILAGISTISPRLLPVLFFMNCMAKKWL